MKNNHTYRNDSDFELDCIECEFLTLDYDLTRAIKALENIKNDSTGNIRLALEHINSALSDIDLMTYLLVHQKRMTAV